MTLRIKSNNGRLECEYSLSKNDYYISWTPIQLSESAEKYIDYFFKLPFELSPTECEVFEIRKEPFDFGTMYNEVLHLKETVASSTEKHEHIFSRSMNQPYPRKCIKCDYIEGTSTELIEQSQDELDFLYSIGEDYHLWDVNEQGKYPIERLLSAVSKRINKLKSKFHITI